MPRRIIFSVISALLFGSLLHCGCTKLDTTNIGSDLLPAVDNVNTFDTILNINATQAFFNDSTLIDRSSDHALGVISNDPLFGTTKANIFLQLKPPYYPYHFGSPGDTTIGFGTRLDSIVLCLNYRGFWGDSTVPIHLEIREVNDAQFRDSVYINRPVTYSPSYSGTILGSANIDVRKLANYTKFTNGRDSVKNQIRIKLSQSWASQLFYRDSITANGSNNAYLNDSIFRRFYNGIAVLSSAGGNGLMYINIADTATKLEIHYTKKNNGTGVIDSVYSSFRLKTSPFGSGSATPSSTVNNIVRNRVGYPISSPASNELYLQAIPGTYINLSIPALSTISNRIIHRADIIVEQIPTNPVTDAIFSAPNFLYVDLADTGSTNRWKPLYFDLNPNTRYDPDFTSGFPYFPTGGVDFFYHGGFRKEKKDIFGNDIKHYNFNVTRYVQRTITQRTPNYNFRIYAPYNINYPHLSSTYVPFSNNIAHGRVRIGSGSNPNYRLRLRLIYSKL